MAIRPAYRERVDAAADHDVGSHDMAQEDCAEPFSRTDGACDGSHTETEDALMKREPHVEQPMIGLSIEPGIVVFGPTMELRYANERARNLMGTSSNYEMIAPQQDDLRVEIIKLGTRVREQDLNEWSSQPASHSEIQTTVRTTQGSFRLLAFAVPDQSCTAPGQIMIVIEDRYKNRRTHKRASNGEWRVTGGPPQPVMSHV